MKGIQKILIVDNDKLFIAMLEDGLKKYGYEVVCANDAIEGLEILGEVRPDAVISDFIMPHVTGDQFCRIIKKSRIFGDLPVILLSAVAAEDAGVLQIADAQIAKGPFDQTLQNIISTIEDLQKGIRPLKDVIGAVGLKKRRIIPELLSYKRHLEAILSSIAEGFLEIGFDGKVLFANLAALQILDLEEELLLASSLGDWVEESSRQKFKEALADIEAGSMDDMEMVTHLNRRPVRIRLRLVEDRRTKTVVAILEDLSESVRLVQEKADLEEQLKQAQRMEILATMSGGIAHDFNNILQAISGYVQVLMLECGFDTRYMPRLKNIEDAVEKGSGLVRRLMMLGKKGEPSFETVWINDKVSNIAELLKRMMPKIELKTALTDENPVVYGDYVQIEQMLINLGINAKEAMEDGGAICFATGVEEVDWLCGKRCAVISISDQGCGMDEDVRKRIFEPFFTTKGNNGGTGLGLAVVYKIVKDHGGRIECKSSPGKGTTFNIYLPCALQA